jgi:hypothetical protein
MQKGLRMRTKIVLVLAAVFALALVGTAFGQDSPTQDAYGGVLGNEVQSGDDQGGGGAAGEQAELATQSADSGSLPFTGFEAGLVALAGFGLVMLGVAMRRTTRRTTT